MVRMIDANAIRYEPMLSARGNGQYEEVMVAYKDQIDDLPTIEERKTGKWIIEPYDAQNDIFIHRCGTCMRVAMLGGHTTRFHYCPLCGSFMEGEQP